MSNWHKCNGITVTSPSAYSCQGCNKDFCWACEEPLSEGTSYEIKTIANRFCEDCIPAEAAVHGLQVDVMRGIRRRAGRLGRAERRAN